MADLKDLYSFKHWWTLVAAVGGAIAIGAAARSHTPILLIGLGLFLFGVGEWISRPTKNHKETMEGMLGVKVVLRNDWEFNALGFALDAVGLGLFAFGIFRLMFH